MQIISNDKTVRKNTIQSLQDFNSQSLTTQAKRREQLVPMTPAIEKAFDLMGDDIVNLSTENDALKNKIGSYDEKWQEKSKADFLKQIADEKSANFLLSKMEKQRNKQNLMAYISYKKIWEPKFDNIVFKKDKVEDLNINQLRST